MRRLLFLNGIKAFEAAARSGSFAGAGAELNVSAAAVSRMVHLLEERLGVALFERKANKLAMTSAGRAYQSGLTPIFDALAPDRAGDRAVQRPGADHRRRPHLCHEMADPAAGGLSSTSPTRADYHHGGSSFGDD
jgi:DNA-binding transcriptional LysR family regulator